MIQYYYANLTKCFEAHPELKEMISKAHKQVREDNLK